MSVNKPSNPQFVDAPVSDSAEPRTARIKRMYNAPGGPLLGWLFDEAQKRQHRCEDMARELGVTYGYIHQLRSGHRQVNHISDSFARSCSRYLSVAPVVVKLLAGRITVEDFLQPERDAQAVFERGLRLMMDDPKIRELLPFDLCSLDPQAQRALVLLYAESTDLDLLGSRHLSATLHDLQLAAVLHDDNAALSQRHQELVVA